MRTPISRWRLLIVALIVGCTFYTGGVALAESGCHRAGDPSTPGPIARADLPRQ